MLQVREACCVAQNGYVSVVLHAGLQVSTTESHCVRIYASVPEVGKV